MTRKLNRKLLLGAAAGVAAVGLAVGGGTYAAFSDFGNINNNSLGAGFLKLDLGADGTGSAPLDFSKIVPGGYTGRHIWIASNNGQSVPSANLFLTLHNLKDTPGPCSTSLGKAAGEQASGIGGCTISGNSATGTPDQGNLSRVVTLQGYYYPNITDPADCAALTGYPTDRNSFFPSGRGNLVAIATGAGTKYEVMEADGTTPLLLAPGQGACIGIGIGWIPQDATTGTPNAPTDNAAQADSLTFDAHFDLVQATSPQPVNNNP